MEKDAKKVLIQFRLDPDTHKKLAAMAKETDRSMNSMFIHIVKEYHKVIFPKAS